MDYLREGIGLRAMAQRDPLVEYQREGFDLFAAMMDGIKEESVGFVFNLEVEVTEEDSEDAASERHAPAISAKGLQADRKQEQLQYSAPSEDGTASVVQPGAAARGAAAGGARAATRIDTGEYAGTPRNAPCPCGSGRKYKRCHGDPKRA
jgi:preprotein translocase subunit SecA